MGLGKLFTREARPAEEHTRAITEFAIIDGVAVDGSGSSAFASRYQGGMQIPGAWRCALLISDLLGSVPWYAYRERAGNPVEKLNPTPIILEQPNPQETGMSTRSGWGLDLLWHGNAIGIIAARNVDNWPTAAWPVPAQTVGTRRIQRGMASALPVGAIEYSVAGITFGESEVIHIKGPCAPGDVRGMGIVEAHFDTMKLSQEQNRQAQSIARSGVPTGILKSSSPETTKAQLQAGKTAMLEAQRDRTIAAMGPGADFTPLSWNPEQLQMVEARKFSLHEWALIFGVPLSFLGAETSNKTYHNDQSESVNLLKYALSGHLARFEQTLSLHLPRGTYAKANLKSVLRADTLTRYQAHAIALDKGFLTLDEVREEEEKAPLPEPLAPPEIDEEVDPDE